MPRPPQSVDKKAKENEKEKKPGSILPEIFIICVKLAALLQYNREKKIPAAVRNHLATEPLCIHKHNIVWAGIGTRGAIDGRSISFPEENPF